MNQQTRKKEVEQILLLPIICDTKKDEIYRKGGIIYTGQKYYSSKDEDMTDFAVGFYHIVYGNILKSKGLLNENGRLHNNNFAGDTMNSFNAIANIVPEAGKSVKQRTEKEKWPLFLQEYHNQYHCLANFWVLPMCIGRRSAKLNKYDSIDIFLNKLKENYTILSQYTDYIENMDNYYEFCKKHFIADYALHLLSDNTQEKYSKGNAVDLINQAYKCMRSRANSISSNNKLCENLYNYFQQLGILSKR